MTAYLPRRCRISFDRFLQRSFLVLTVSSSLAGGGDLAGYFQAYKLISYCFFSPSPSVSALYGRRAARQPGSRPLQPACCGACTIC